MSYFIFFILNFLILVIRSILVIVIIIGRNLSKFIGKRLDFERKNIFGESSQSFKKINKKADFLFHVSSEGELEQVRPIIEKFLQDRKLIEVIFTSESVENKCEKMFLENKNQLRIYRLPVLSFFPFSFLYFQSVWSFATAPVIIFCRYDFFPELLFFKYFGKKMVLISGATKKLNWSKKESYKYFDLIVAANEIEKGNFLKLVPDIEIDDFDFRIPRIFKRADLAQNVLEQNPTISNYVSKIKNCSSLKIILGSMWKSDLPILLNDELILALKTNELKIFIAPHKLNSAFVLELGVELSKLGEGIEVSYFDGKLLNEEIELKPINIITAPGILCELYSLFDLAYVGGGYEKSIHSVLEPFLMGTKVITGPIINRSTEYDYVKHVKPDEIIVLKNPNSFYNELKELMKKAPDKSLRFKLKEQSSIHFESMIKKIESRA